MKAVKKEGAPNIREKRVTKSVLPLRVVAGLIKIRSMMVGQKMRMAHFEISSGGCALHAVPRKQKGSAPIKWRERAGAWAKESAEPCASRGEQEGFPEPRKRPHIKQEPEEA